MEYRLEKFDSGMHYFVLDAVAVEQFAADGNKRVICTLNHSITFHCALMPKKEGGCFINVGSRICKQLGIAEGSFVMASFRPDDSPYQFDMPEELSEVLATDPDASNAFHSLTEGNQRGLIYLVTQVKSTDKRIERALRIADQIRRGITSPKLILK